MKKFIVILALALLSVGSAFSQAEYTGPALYYANEAQLFKTFTNYITTPFELARLMVAIHRGAVGGAGGVRRLGIASRTARSELLARLLDVRDRSKLVAGLPPGVPVAHKTGYTEEVKHDGGIIYLRSGPVAAAVMTWSASGVGDATGDRFIAAVARAARARLAGGGACQGLPLSSGGPAG